MDLNGTVARIEAARPVDAVSRVEGPRAVVAYLIGAGIGAAIALPLLVLLYGIHLSP